MRPAIESQRRRIAGRGNPVQRFKLGNGHFAARHALEAGAR